MGPVKVLGAPARGQGRSRARATGPSQPSIFPRESHYQPPEEAGSEREVSGGASCRAQQAGSSGRAPSCPASRRRQPGADLPRQGEGFSQRSYPRGRDYGELLGWARARAGGRPGGNPKPPQLFPVCRLAGPRGRAARRAARTSEGSPCPSLRPFPVLRLCGTQSVSRFLSVSLSHAIREIFKGWSL